MSKKTAIALILVLMLSFSLFSCGEDTEVFTNGRISIELPLYFSAEQKEDGSVSFYTPSIEVNTYSLDEDAFRVTYSYTGDCTLAAYLECFATEQGMNLSEVEPVYDDEIGCLAFEYAASEDGEAYYYMHHTVFLRDGIFFVVVMSCDEPHMEECVPKFEKWRETITILDQA